LAPSTGLGHAADTVRVDQDFADVVLRLGGCGGHAGLGGGDLVVADPQARAIAAAGSSGPS
jgi:hypothetical protein